MQAVSIVSSRSSLRQLDKRMAAVKHYSDWLDLAQQHDALSGAEKWRGVEKSRLYDYQEIKARHSLLRQCLDNGAYRELLYALNEGVHGNMGGMGQPIMYMRSKCGTKELIDQYVETISDSLMYIYHCPEQIISHTEKLDFFRRASHCYGRSALLLSGGAGLIYFHHGVVQELIDHNLLPNVISGASAGSIVSAQLGIYTDEELKAGYFSKKRYIETSRTPLLGSLTGKLTEAEARASRERFQDEVIPKDITFQEAFEHTGRYINISISAAEKHQNSRLMNAITSPNVYIRSAVSASSSIPGVIPPERLYAKGFDGKPRRYLANRRWVDGSVSGDLPAKRLMRLYGVNHFIVSLINPFVLPFVKDTKIRKSKGLSTAITESLIRMYIEALGTSERLFDRRGGAVGRRIAAQIAYVSRMLDQDYLGDINILLDQSEFNWRQALFDFKDGEIENLIDVGMRSTWPKISMIKNAARVSKTLDYILENLNAQSVDDKPGSKHHIYS